MVILAMLMNKKGCIKKTAMISMRMEKKGSTRKKFMMERVMMLKTQLVVLMAKMMGKKDGMKKKA